MSGINPRKLAPKKAIVSTISSLVEIIDSFRNAIIILPNGITLNLENVLSNIRSRGIYLALKNVCYNGLRH